MLLDRTAVLAVLYLTIREIIKGIGEDQEFTPELRLVEDLGADSLDQTEILMKLEEEFPTADFGEFPYRDDQTLGDIADFVCQSAERAGSAPATEPVTT